MGIGQRHPELLERDRLILKNMGTIKYCDYASGNDSTGNGSAANPYKTITKASTGLTGGDEVRCAKSPDDTALTGTITFTRESTTITGSGTLFSSELAIGDFVKGGDGEYYEVVTIASNTAATLYKKYPSTTASGVASYKMGYTDTGAAASSTTEVQKVSASGSSAGSMLTISGGWNLSTQTQTGKTIFRQMHTTFSNRYGYGLYLLSKSYVDLAGNIGFCRYYSGIFYTTSSNNTISGTVTCNSNGAYGIIYSAGNNTISGTVTCNSNNTCGIYYSASNNTISGTVTCNSNGYCGIYYYSAGNNTISGTVTCNSNDTYGIFYSAANNNNVVGSLTTAGNGASGMYQDKGSVNYINNSSIGESTEVSTVSDYSNSKLFSTKHDQTLHNDWIFMQGATINKQNTTTQSGSGYAWKTTIINSERSSIYPAKLSIAKIACAASSQVTVTAYVKKDHASNVAAKLICRRGQIAGVSSDVEDAKADDTNWEQLTLQFTPTEVGVVEIELWSWYVAGASNVYVDTISCEQS